MSKITLDATDRKILRFLVKNARMPFLEIARECGISGAAIHQRIKKLEAAFGKKAEILQRRSGDFGTLRSLGKVNRTQIAQELADVRKFLASGSSRVKEYGQIRENIIESFQRSGYDFVNESNLDDLYQFLEDTRARNIAALYGSDQLVETWNRARKRGLTEEQLLGNIEYWAEHPGKSQRLYASRKTSREDFVEASKKWRL